MRIRSITCFFDPALVDYPTALAQLSKFSQKLSDVLQPLGIEVQSRRVVTTPFPTYTSQMTQTQALEWMLKMEAEAVRQGFAYMGCGPALVEYPESCSFIPEFLKHSKNTFTGTVIADRFAIYPEAVRAAARVIVKAAPIDVNGFANLQFAALANVPAEVPFFPSAYHKTGNGLTFALAIECADVVLEAFTGSNSLQTSRQTMLIRMETFADQIQKCIPEASAGTDIHFAGFDFSPAPFPYDGCSLGGAMEAVGQNRVGADGALAAAAVIADTLDAGRWPRAGFNGMMMPVLEDSVLARRAAEGTFSVKDLLLYSAVCGTGLDTVPIPGDSTEDEIAAVLFDVAALSVRLGKPLTARLMPIPGKKAGDQTNFDFDFFAPSRVLPLCGGKVALPLNGTENIPLTPRSVQQRMRRRA
jgi:uncharacterized protein (UPF0210 family)